MDTSDRDAYVNDTFGVDPASYVGSSDTDPPSSKDDVPPATDPPTVDAPPAAGEPSTLPDNASDQDQPVPVSAGRSDALADDVQPVPLDAASPLGDPPAAGDKKVVLVDNTQPPIDINADTLNDFITKTNQVIGNPHANIDAVPDVATTDGVCTGVVITVNTAIVRPRLGLSRASGKERDLINKAVELIKNHEERHRSIAQMSYDKAAGEMLGKTGADALKTFKVAATAHDAAQDAFDKANGKLIIIKDSDGTPSDVTTGPL